MADRGLLQKTGILGTLLGMALWMVRRMLQRSKPQTKLVASKKGKPKESLTLDIYYASQRGTTEDLAREFARLVRARNLKFCLTNLDDFTEESFRLSKVAVFFLATYGTGDPPDAGCEFMDYLDETSDDLSALKYAIFGIGDSTYAFYQGFARRTDQALIGRGAQPFFPKAEGDQDLNFRSTYEYWTNGFFEALATLMPVPPPQKESSQFAAEARLKVTLVPDVARTKMERDYTGYGPGFSGYGTSILSQKLWQYLVGTVKTNRQVSANTWELTFANTIHAYQTANTVYILPGNPASLVDWFCEHVMNIGEKELGQVLEFQVPNPESPQEFRRPFPPNKRLQEILTYYVDLIRIPRSLYFESRGNLNCGNLQEFCAKYQIRDTWETFIQEVGKQAGRPFSIASSAAANGEECSLLVTRVPNGLCSNFLCDAHPKDRLYFVFEDSPFKAFANAGFPLIMIGSGSGLAPFRGLLQEFRHSKKAPPTPHLLIFGCRTDQDLLDPDLIATCQAEGLLNFWPALSRTHGQYCQDVVAQKMGALVDLCVNKQAAVLFCGNPSMVKGVQDLMRAEFPPGLFQEMEAHKRIVVEHWS